MSGGKADAQVKAILEKRNSLIKAQRDSEAEALRLRGEINQLHNELLKIEGQDELVHKIIMRW